MNKRLRELRTEFLKLSQKEFADKLQITQAGLSKIELGGSILTERNIKTICEKFNVNEEWLRNGIEPIFINGYSHMSINERIKILRTQILKNENGKSYSQRKFAEKLGVSPGVINNIDTNLVEAKDNVIKLICLTFNVNEEWLRNGVEPIFKEDSKEKPLIQLLEEEYNIKPIAKKIIEVYLSLGEEEQTMFENFARKVFEECNISFNENSSNITDINTHNKNKEDKEMVKIIARGKGITTISKEELERIKSTGVEVDNINDYF